MTANYPDYPEGSTAASTGGENGGSPGAPQEQAKEQAKQVAGTAADQGRQVAATAADEARQVAGVAQGEAQRVASEATAQVRGLLSEATTQVTEQSRTQLSRLSETLRSLGEDLERMASQGEGPASGLAHEAGERTRGLASHLEGRELADLLEDVRGFARRRPGAFLVGALAAGVVAGRLTRGAKAAQDGADPTSGRVLDTSTRGHGTASGEPLAGTGTPVSPPVYPGGVEDGRA